MFTFIVMVLQVLLPVGLLVWLAWGRPKSRATWLLRAATVLAYLFAIALAGIWLVLPWYTPWIYAIFFAAALWHSAGRAGMSPGRPRGAREWTGVVCATIALFAFVAVASLALTGRVTPVDTVSLEFPLGEGVYYVPSAGANSLLNFHYRTLVGDRYRAYRGQSFGVDIVKVGRWGLRAPGLLPSDPATYEIWGESVQAPCSGAVIGAADGLLDMRPPVPDRDHLFGNHVWIDCGPVWVLLAHLQRGSVRVEQGNDIVAGQVIGLVGNSGNSGEPHLHVHAQRPGSSVAVADGEPVHVEFDGGFLARNSRVRR